VSALGNCDICKAETEVRKGLATQQRLSLSAASGLHRCEKEERPASLWDFVPARIDLRKRKWRIRNEMLYLID